MHDYRLEVRAQIFRHRLNYCEIANQMHIPLRELLSLMRTPLNEADAKKITDAIDGLAEGGE